MPGTVFDSSFFFENEIYDQYQDNVFHSRKKQSRDDFASFLMENLKEMEFTKIKNKQNSISCEYQFEEDKKHKIRLIEDKKEIELTALYENKANDDIEQQVVDKENDASFIHLMDRVMDALEVMERAMFGLECKTNGAPAKFAKRRTETPKKRKKKEDKEETEEYDPISEQEVSEQEESDASESSSDKDPPKRRSNRLSSKKRKRNEIDLIDTEDDSDVDTTNNKKKKRKMNKPKPAQRRTQKRAFVQRWVKGQYCEAIHYVEDKYSTTKREINTWIDEMYDQEL
eukprot:342905_1